jgi:hypothetical protein
MGAERRFGKYKKVVRASTGVAYKVPTRDIIEHGLKERELDKYPLWPDSEPAGGVAIATRDGRDGIQAGNLFIPFHQKAERIDAVVVAPAFWEHVPGSIRGTCSRCGQEVWVSPSTQILLAQQPGVPIICAPCMYKQLKEMPGG